MTHAVKREACAQHGQRTNPSCSPPFPARTVLQRPGPSAGHVLFDLFGEVVNRLRAQVDAGIRETFLEDMAHIILDVAQADLITDVVGNAFRSLHVLHPLRAVIGINEGIGGVS